MSPPSRATGPSRSQATVIGVGTTRQPKLDAVELVLRELRERFPAFLPGELRLEPRQVPSGAPSTPTTTEETMRGARNRARNTFELLEREGITPSLRARETITPVE